jgi:creatinine amidohydrolase
MLKRMEHMNWVEFRDAAKQTNTAIIPIGAIEMQGPHLPLGVDSMVAEFVGEKVGEKANVVLAPPIIVGTSEWHKNFAGMIGLDKQTLTEYLRQYCRCLARDGYNHLFFLSPHVFNEDPIGSVALELRDEGILVGSVNLWHVTNEIVQSRNIDIKEKTFTHAGEIMMDKAVAEAPSSPIQGTPVVGLHKIKFNDMSFSIYRSSNEETKSGSLGDPSAASAEKGRKIIEGWVETIVAFLEVFRKC